MANNFIPEELQALIEQYLTDGILTEKERNVILKKAESMGLDRDEIDLYLDAEVQKIDQATDAAVRRQKGKQCPFCGASLPMLADKCPECGQYITPEASKELQDIVEKLEDALLNFKSGKDIKASKATAERYIRQAKMYYENHPKIKILLREIETEIAVVDNKNKTATKLRWIGAGVCFVIAAILFIVGATMDVEYAPEPDSFWKKKEETPSEKKQAGILLGGMFLTIGGAVLAALPLLKSKNNDKDEG